MVAERGILYWETVPQEQEDQYYQYDYGSLGCARDCVRGNG